MVKNITFSADERVIHQAREKALKEKKALNTVFREWLARYAQGEAAHIDYDDLMKQLKHVRVGKHFTRDDMNER